MFLTVVLRLTESEAFLYGSYVLFLFMTKNCVFCFQVLPDLHGYMLTKKYIRMETIIMPWLVLAGLLGFCICKIWYAYRCAVRERKRNGFTVVARIKKEDNSLWLCKFFFWGDHVGFFRKKPSSDRVQAWVVCYDKNLGMYELEELGR